MTGSDWVRLIMIPFFAGEVDWLINWTGAARSGSCDPAWSHPGCR